MKTGVIGLGAMGAPMARNLHRAGYLETIWNRSAARAQQLGRELGVPVAASPAALAELCELVILSVSSDEDVLEVVEALRPGLTAGKIVLDTSTVSRETAQQAAALLAENNTAFVDGPVSGGIEGARNATLAMMAGGDRAVLDQIRPLLDSITGRVEHMGPVGAGQATKAVNQVMAAGINQAVSEALAFASALELPMDKVTVTVKHEKIHAADCAECETRVGKIDSIDREIHIEGDLTDEQRKNLMRIADKCPVHRTLHSEVVIKSRLA